MATNTTMSNISLLQLPVEVLHWIFDYLDTQTIFDSIRPVCTQLHAIVKTYNKFRLNFSSSSMANLRFMGNFIQPENIISLILPDLSRTTLFFSLFQLDRFTRLQSLTLVEINGTALDQFFHHIIEWPLPLKLLSITLCRQQTIIETERIINLLSSTIAQSGLQNLHLNIFNAVLIMDSTLQPIQNTLQHLTIKSCKYRTYHVILCRCVHLRTFVIGNCDMENRDQIVLPSFVRSSYPQLTSLTLNSCYLPINELHLLLLLTPSLVHLEVIAKGFTAGYIFDGHLWEGFIKTNLPLLKKFEFIFIYFNDEKKLNHSLHSIITPFRTPFWLNDKHWLVTCDYVLSSYRIILHTLPFNMADVDIVIRCDSLSSTNGDRLVTGYWLNHLEHVSTEQVFENLM